MKKVENFFCVFYLIFAYVATIIFFLHGNNSIVNLFGIMTFLLAFGDSFHLIPRILKGFKWKFNFQWWSGLGLMISSVTMTIFYVILYYIWRGIFNDFSYPILLYYVIWISAIIRIILCLFPQNNWFSEKGNLRWSYYRNIPFIFTGFSEAYLFLMTGNTYNLGLEQIGIAIIISFLCYLPVAFFAKKYPKLGMLMIPKTCAYIWIICVGLSLINKLH